MEHSCQPNICGYTNKCALRYLSNLGISANQTKNEMFMWHYNQAWILHF
jgi:hypothetical protein